MDFIGLEKADERDTKQRVKEGEEEIYIVRERDRERERYGKSEKERVSDIDMHREYRMREPA
jgi:hypothetical protein